MVWRQRLGTKSGVTLSCSSSHPFFQVGLYFFLGKLRPNLWLDSVHQRIRESGRERGGWPSPMLASPRHGFPQKESLFFMAPWLSPVLTSNQLKLEQGNTQIWYLDRRGSFLVMLFLGHLLRHLLKPCSCPNTSLAQSVHCFRPPSSLEWSMCHPFPWKIAGLPLNSLKWTLHILFYSFQGCLSYLLKLYS